MTATTWTVNKLIATAGDNNVDLPILVQSNLSLIRRESTPDYAVYNNVVGDMTLPSRVTSRIALFSGPKILVPSFQWTVAFETCQLITDGDGNVSAGAPMTWGHWCRLPIDHTPSKEEIMRGFGTVHGLLGASITSGVIDLGRVEKARTQDAYVYGS